MSWPLLATCLVLGAAGQGSAVYHFKDAQGVDHYVNHPEQVPAGTSSDQLKLTEDLNPNLAREMAASAKRAGEEARTLAAQEKANEKKDEAPSEPEAVPLPVDARLVLIWAIAFTVVFLVLWSTRGVLLRHSTSLAVAFQPLRWGTGVAALLSWIFLAVLARGWIVDHFPPLRAIRTTRVNVEKINRDQREAEHELEKSLNGK